MSILIKNRRFYSWSSGAPFVIAILGYFVGLAIVSFDARNGGLVYKFLYGVAGVGVYRQVGMARSQATISHNMHPLTLIFALCGCIFMYLFGLLVPVTGGFFSEYAAEQVIYQRLEIMVKELALTILGLLFLYDFFVLKNGRDTTFKQDKRD